MPWVCPQGLLQLAHRNCLPSQALLQPEKAPGGLRGTAGGQVGSGHLPASFGILSISGSAVSELLAVNLERMVCLFSGFV